MYTYSKCKLKQVNLKSAEQSRSQKVRTDLAQLNEVNRAMSIPK